MRKETTVKVSPYCRDWLRALKTQMCAPSINDALVQLIIACSEEDGFMDNVIERGRRIFSEELPSWEGEV